MEPSGYPCREATRLRDYTVGLSIRPRKRHPSSERRPSPINRTQTDASGPVSCLGTCLTRLSQDVLDSLP